MGELHKNYLFDLGYLLRERALEAKQKLRDARGTTSEAFAEGRLMAYYEVLSLLLGQAISFELPVEDLHLQELDPNRDLLGWSA
jgi:hypothetical protein